MTARHVACLCLALITAAALAACSGGGSASSPGQAPPQALRSSTAALSTMSYAVTLTTPDYHAIGAVDPVRAGVHLTAKGTHGGAPITVEEVSIGPDSWARIDLGGSGSALGIPPDKWLRLDPLDLGAGSLPFDQAHLTDAFDIQTVLGTATDVTRTDGEHYAGRVDLTAVSVNSMIPAGSALGAAGRDLPFTATTDGQGRLTHLTVRTSATGSSATGSSAAGTGGTVFDFVVSDYGAAARAVRPDDVDVIKAPPGAYSLLSLR